VLKPFPRGCPPFPLVPGAATYFFSDCLRLLGRLPTFSEQRCSPLFPSLLCRLKQSPASLSGAVGSCRFARVPSSPKSRVLLHALHSMHDAFGRGSLAPARPGWRVCVVAGVSSVRSDSAGFCSFSEGFLRSLWWDDPVWAPLPCL